jgi:hypothetical protein
MTRSTLAVAAIAAALLASTALGNDSDSQSRVCFPASAWNADDTQRPCARLVRVLEDGSVRVQVTDADGEVRFTTGVGALDR